jgi:hypothetical protein
MTSTETPARTTEFVVGETYSVRSLGDWECIWTFTVVKRTAKFVTLVDAHGDTYRVGVTTWDGVERCMPFGRYSMAPSLVADRPVA